MVQDPFQADSLLSLCWLGMRRLRLLTLFSLVIGLQPTGAGAHMARVPASTVLLARNRTEPVVAVDPANPSHVVALTNTNYSSAISGTFPPGEYWSADGGKNFGSGSAPIVYPYTTTADPSVAIAQDGTVFASYLGEVPAYCEGGAGAVIVAHSIDHGRSLRSPVVADSSSADDKPFMAVESGGRDHIFLAWDRIHQHTTAIWYTRSTDGGAHFEPSRGLFSSRTNNYGPVVVAAPAGRIYVFWANFPDGPEKSSLPTGIMMRSSTDDGRHFSPPRVVAGPFRAIPQITQPGSLRNITMPAAIADSKGNLWLAWARPTAQFPGGRVNVNIELKRSSDGGKTWSGPVPVNDVSSGDRFMPAMTLWADRSVGLAFYDRRRSGSLIDVYGARAWYRRGIEVSRNVRLNRTNAPVSDIHYIAPNSTCFAPGRFFGDYMGAAAQPHGILCAVWSDTELHIPDETDIWFARVAVPKQPRSG